MLGPENQEILHLVRREGEGREGRLGIGEDLPREGRVAHAASDDAIEERAALRIGSGRCRRFRHDASQGSSEVAASEEGGTCGRIPVTAEAHPDDTVPDRPHLRPGVYAFEDGDGLVVRSVAGAFRIDPRHDATMRRVLPRLDGAHDLSALLGGEPAAAAFYVLRMLGWFAQSGLLVDRPRIPAARIAPEPVARDVPLLWLPGRGALADALAGALARTGLAVAGRGGLDEAPPAGAVRVTCLDGPDLDHLDAAARAARAEGAAWFPVFPFGDAVMVGPLAAPESGPCPRCVLLRWLGISPTIALERAYHDHLRQGGWRLHPPVPRPEAADLADDLARAVCAGLGGPRSGGWATLLHRGGGDSEAGPVERHPLCPDCRAATASPPDDRRDAWFDAPLPLASLGAHLRDLAAGPGALTRLVPPPRGRASARDPALPAVAVGRFAVPDPAIVTGRQTTWCHGSGACLDEARTVALIEGLERYAGLHPGEHGLVAPYEAVADRALRPTDLPLFSPAQYAEPDFPFRPFDPAEPLGWVPGYDLSRDRPVLVPRTAARYGVDDRLLGETSSGVAAHSARGAALLNGALELVERDAFMIHWLHRLSPPRIDRETIASAASRAMLDAVAAGGYAVHLRDLTTDLRIPVCLAVGTRTDRAAPALIVGAGAALDAATALARAARELYAATLHVTGAWRLGDPLEPGAVLEIDDHAKAYEHPDWLPQAAFLWASPAPAAAEGWRAPARTPVPTSLAPADDLTALMARLAERGHSLVGVDITPPELARRSLRVVRAIVPGLQPLGFGRRIRLGGRRLYEAPPRMGAGTFAQSEDALNPVPHCFP